MKKTFLSSLLHFLMTIIIILIVLNGGILIYHYLQEFQSPLLSPRKTNSADLSVLHSRNFILVNLDSEKVIAQQNSEDKIYPASMTKMMTAILAIENTADLDEWTSIPEDIYSSLYEQDASMAGFEPGESVPFRDVLYGILLPSGCECCEAFAQWIAGSEEDFVKRMNQKAEELGMNSTHFANATGLHQDNHYTTVKDLSLLMQYALKNDDFREVITSRYHSTYSSEEHPGGFTFRSTLFKTLEEIGAADSYILGGKTGYTQYAGLCLASLASVDGSNYMIVSANADGSHDTEPYHALDHLAIYAQLAGES